MSKKRKIEIYYDSHDDYIEEDTLAPQHQRLRVQMEKKGRGGKTVSIIKGFVGTTDDLSDLISVLKKKIGIGGTVKDGEGIIQGDHKKRIIELLKSMGYTDTR